MTANEDIPGPPPGEPRLRLRYEPGPDDKQLDLTVEPDPPAQLDWKQYETYVFQPSTCQLSWSRYSEERPPAGSAIHMQRQIDILVRQQVTGLDIRIAFDCKHHNRELNVRHVEAFLSMLEDIGVSKGVIITGRGYSKPLSNGLVRAGETLKCVSSNFGICPITTAWGALSRGSDR
jgi:hypothetical protein